MAHDHKHTVTEMSGSRLFITMILNFGITAAEIIGGILAGSLSLISDALHNFSDGIAIIISYIAIRLKLRPRDAHYTFGLKRSEIIAAIINASTLIIICFYLFREAYQRLVAPEPVAGGLMIIVASFGLVANVAGTLLLRSGSKNSMNIRSVYLHLLSDAVSSLAVILGGIAIYFFHVYWLDPLLTVLIGLYVLKESYGIVAEAVQIIMMAAPADISLTDLKREIETVVGVQNLHHVHLWQMNEQDIHFEGHVEVDDIPVSETGDLLRQIEQLLLEKYAINHVTVQFECNRCSSKALVKETER